MKPGGDIRIAIERFGVQGVCLEAVGDHFWRNAPTPGRRAEGIEERLERSDGDERTHHNSGGYPPLGALSRSDISAERDAKGWEETGKLFFPVLNG